MNILTKFALFSVDESLADQKPSLKINACQLKWISAWKSMDFIMVIIYGL